MVIRCVLGILATSLWLQTAGAQPCADYSMGMQVVGSVYMSAARQVVVNGDRAYTRNIYGVQILDITVPEVPVVVGEVPMNPWAIANRDHFVYAALQTPFTFHVIDASDPSSASIVGSTELTHPYGTDAHIAISPTGGFAYVVTTSQSMLQIVDISDPEAPTRIGSVDLPSPAWSIRTAGQHALVPCEAGLTILDLSTPSAPTVAGVVDTYGSGYYVASQGEFAYLSTAFLAHSTLQVLDWSDPSDAHILGSVPAPVGEVATQGDVAFVATGNRGVTSIHVGDPWQPTVIGNSLPDLARSIGLAGDRAYVAYNNGVSVLDISDPNTTQPLALSAPLDNVVTGLAITGNYVFASIHARGLQVLDISSPAQVGSVAFLALDGNPQDIAIAGNIACIAAKTAVHIVDISAPESPAVLSTLYSLAGQPYYIEFDGTYAYASASSHAHILDVTDPTHATLVGELPLGGYRVRKAGDYLYVASGGGLHVLDASIPSDPTVVGSVDLPQAIDLVVHGPYAYVLGQGELFVVDISDAASPTVVYVLEGYGSQYSANHQIARLGENLYVALDNHGFYAVDIGVPDAPRILGTSGPALFVSALVPGGGVLLVGQYGSIGAEPERVVAFPPQCGAPTPIRLSRLQAYPRLGAVELSWRASLYLDYEGFDVFRSSSMTWGYERVNPEPVRGRGDCLYVDRSVEPSRTYFYRVAPSDPGGSDEFLGPIEVTTPPRVVRPTLEPAFPNPFTVETTLAFSLPAAGPVRVDVYDVSGRRVRTLMEGEVPEGPQNVTWDGHDQAGHRVAGGAYVIRLRTGDDTRTRKVVLLGQ